MKIGFGALGEGYAADRSKALMQKRNVKAGIINGSGDMNSWGRQPDGSYWSIGIRDPIHVERIFAVMPLKTNAVVTSGSYEKFVIFNGKRYTHIIDPKTGYPVEGVCSVTIFGSSAELANGLSTSVMVLGKKKGIALLKKYPEMKYIIFDDDGKFSASPDLNLRTFIVAE